MSLWRRRLGFGLRGRIHRLFCKFHYDTGAVGKDFRHPGRYVVGIVAHADDRVASRLEGVLAQKLKGLLTGLLAKLGVQADVAAEEGLNTGREVADGAA